MSDHNIPSNMSASPEETTISSAVAPQNRAWSLSRFDKMVLLVIGVLAAFIGLTILLGDRVGVTLDRVGPLGVARSTAPILLQFSETMNRDTLAERLRVVEVQPGTVAETLQLISALLPAHPIISGSLTRLIRHRPSRSRSRQRAYSITASARMAAKLLFQSVIAILAHPTSNCSTLTAAIYSS
jgi:hypothetical protein